ncbi:MAG: class I SAM-dependent methyltransferase, partial [Thiomicrorhabdus sp.]|nr:class I SAM-dependent methyltransferase [Thiomicrorhabdus sp.]
MLKSVSVPRQNFISRLFSPFSIKQWVLKLPFDQLEKGSLTLELFGETYRFEGKQPGRHAELKILKPLRAYWLLKTQGELGFAQAYFEQAVDTNSLYSLMHLCYENQSALSALLAHKTLNAWQLIKHRNRHNSQANSKKNIAYHYDLGNAFYQKWLDRSMTYSSAIFANDDQSLEQAQIQKYHRLMAQMNVQAGDEVLEIGC